MTTHQPPDDDATQAIPAVTPDDGDLIDEEWERPRSTNTLTFVLLALLIAALGFAAGVLAQRALTPGAAPAPAAAVSAWTE